MADPVHHTPDLSLPALVYGDLYPGVRFFLADLPDPCRGGLPVIKIDPLRQFFQRRIVQLALDLHQIGLRQFMTGVRDKMRKIPVVREQQHPLGVIIQPADGIDTGPDAFQEVLHQGPFLRVGHRRNIARGLVQHDVGLGLSGVDELAVDLDMVFPGVRLGAEFGHYFAVHAHPALKNDILGSAPRSNTGG